MPHVLRPARRVEPELEGGTADDLPAGFSLASLPAELPGAAAGVARRDSERVGEAEERSGVDRSVTFRGPPLLSTPAEY
jgi:hypothetical protein